MSKHDHLKIVFAAIDFIEKSLLDPISVQDVCSQVPLSSWQFQRLFRAIVGDSIGGYLRSRRLTQAAELLIKSNNKILDIAVLMQFGSQEAFARAFKSQFTVTPGQIRENSNFVKLYKKPRITRETLSHLQIGIQREPIICKLGPLNLIGVETTISSFLGENPDFESKLPIFWRKFDQLKKIHNMDMNADNYGVAISASESMMEENLIYFAGISSDEKKIPGEMVSLQINEKRYAIFENIGLAEKSLATIDFIYGTWLPDSGYKRAKGFDFEIFDHRYSLDNPHSVSRYCLPIE